MNARLDLPTSTEKPAILDIPPGWGNTVEEFKQKILKLISPFTRNSPEEAIRYPDGSTVPFYPVFEAATPEYGILTREELRELLRPAYIIWAEDARKRATTEYADHMFGTEYLAWGLKEGIFSEKEIAKIWFDGDTVESYIAEFGRVDILEEHIDRLLHPRCAMPIRFSEESSCDDHCCC